MMPAMSSPVPTKPIEQLFAYLRDSSDRWPQVWENLIWRKEVFVKR